MNIVAKPKLLSMLIAGLLVLLAGCSSTPKLPEVATLPCYFPYSKEEAPMWICTGYVEGLITGIGIFPKSEAGYNLKFQTAQQRARVDLLEKFEIRIKAVIKDYEDVTGASSNVISDQFIQQVSLGRIANTLQGSRTYASITGPDGALYVLVGIDKEIAANNIKRMARSSYDNAEAQYINDKAEKQFKALDEHIDRAVVGYQ